MRNEVWWRPLGPQLLERIKESFLHSTWQGGGKSLVILLEVLVVVVLLLLANVLPIHGQRGPTTFSV